MNDKVNGRIKQKKTLCWNCEWAAGKDKKCPWATRFEPVPGWKATKSYILSDVNSKNRVVDSYIVHECPLFQMMEILKNRIAKNADLKSTWKREKEEDKKAIVELRKQGKTIEEISYITGHCPRTIYRILQDAKFKKEVEQ